jgi:hypothetical protein
VLQRKKSIQSIKYDTTEVLEMINSNKESKDDEK